MFNSIRGTIENKKITDSINNIGDTVTLGNFDYKVNNFEIRNSDDMEDRNDLIVSVDVKSNSNKSESTSLDPFVLIIGEKSFEADLYRGANANAGSNPFNYEPLNPEQTIKGFIVFNISKKQAESKDFKLLISETATITLE